MIRKFLLLLVWLTFVSSSLAQETQPTPASSGNTTAEQRMAQLQEEILLLKKQQELEKAKSEISNQRLQEIINALPKNSSLKSFDGKTDFQDDKDSNAESIALSYDALKEVTALIYKEMKAELSRYSGLVIYNEPDFLALAKYRVYRNQSRVALRNYDLLAGNLEKLSRENNLPEMARLDRFGTRNINPLTMALSLPSIGTSYARSVAELFSVFRTDTIITQSRDTIDSASLGTAMTNELRKKNPNLKIFYPQAFVPEYDLETEGQDSLFEQLSKINSASAYLGEFSLQVGKIPERERGASPIREAISFAETVKKQMQSLTIAEAAPGGQNSRTESDAAKINMSEFRQLVRAEKLDRFLRGNRSSVSSNLNEPQIGILKLRVLASGGSRRETRNFFLGNKLSFSGSAVVEMLLFDADGTLRASEIFSLHTGFRKMKEKGK